MADTEYKVHLPETFSPLLNRITGDTIDKKIQVALAINLFVNKTVTLEKAASLSGETLVDFIEILNEQNIAWLEYTEEHKKQDDRVIKKMMKEMEKNI